MNVYVWHYCFHSPQWMGTRLKGPICIYNVTALYTNPLKGLNGYLSSPITTWDELYLATGKFYILNSNLSSVGICIVQVLSLMLSMCILVEWRTMWLVDWFLQDDRLLLCIWGSSYLWLQISRVVRLKCHHLAKHSCWLSLGCVVLDKPMLSHGRNGESNSLVYNGQ